MGKKGWLDGLVDGTFEAAESFGGCLLKIAVLAVWVIIVMVIVTIFVPMFWHRMRDFPLAIPIGLLVAVITFIGLFIWMKRIEKNATGGKKRQKKRKKIERVSKSMSRPPHL
jgi:NADH:ubiquinone oxidoreductase subunit 6 (subunit J)